MKYLICYMGHTTNPAAFSSLVQPGNQLHDSHGFEHDIRIAILIGNEIAPLTWCGIARPLDLTVCSNATNVITVLPLNQLMIVIKST